CAPCNVYVIHQAVHIHYILAFPTRRSSDLGAATGAHNGAGVRLGDAATARNHRPGHASARGSRQEGRGPAAVRGGTASDRGRHRDRKSTRLNSSHVSISYAVFCLKKKDE